MNILVVHETEYIEKVVFEYQIIPELWASWGHNVYVVDFPTKLDKKGIFDLGTFKTKVFKNVKKADKKRGITLIRPGFVKLPVISRMTAYISHFFAIRRAIIDNKIDVIFQYSVPTNGLQTVFWARKFKIPVHFRLLDVLHLLVPYKILARPTYWMEKMVYKRADDLTAITPRLKDYAIKLGARKTSTIYLPSGSDRDLFYPKTKDSRLCKKFGLKKDDTVLLFAGTLYNFSGLDGVIEYFGKHKTQYPALKLLILGHGEQENRLKKLVEEQNFSNQVILAGFIDYKILANYLNLADICINPFEVNGVTNIIFPGKIYQYLACAKPVIATRLKGVLDIFPENKNQQNIFYYNADKVGELFAKIEKIRKIKIKDPNPSLQEIAKTLEGRLELLASRKKKS